MENYKSILSQCKTMKKDFVISRIEASQDGSPYVYVTLTDPNDYKAGAEKPQNPFGPNMMAFTSPEDLMKNLPKAMGNLSKAMGDGGPLTDSPQKLRFERDNEKLKLLGKELTKDTTYSNLKKRKFDVINRVFRSMANLIFFFKNIAEYPELEKVFEDDFKDLLGLTRNDPKKQDLGFVFYDLLDYIIIGRKGGRYSEKEDDRVDFRLILSHIAQKIVCYKMRQSSVSILKMGGARSSIMNDFDKVWGWTEMLSFIAKHDLDDEVPPNRTFDFLDHGISKE